MIAYLIKTIIEYNIQFSLWAMVAGVKLYKELHGVYSLVAGSL